MYALSEIERAETTLWESVRALYGPDTQPGVEAAASVVESLAAYRAAVEQSARLRLQASSGALAVIAG